jgi:hypothetical protein
MKGPQRDTVYTDVFLRTTSICREVLAPWAVETSVESEVRKENEDESWMTRLTHLKPPRYLSEISYQTNWTFLPLAPDRPTAYCEKEVGRWGGGEGDSGLDLTQY